MLTRRPHNLGTVPTDAAPEPGTLWHYGGTAYSVAETRPVLWRASGDPVPRVRVYGWPIRQRPARPTLVSRLFATLGLVAALIVLVIAASVSTPAANAITTAQYVARPGNATSHLMAYHAHGRPGRCDYDHNGRYGRKQAECVVRVVFRHDGARVIHDGFRVIDGESGWDSHSLNHNTNGSTDCGPWQINSIHGQSCRRMMDWVLSTLFAHRLWVSVGRHFSPTWVAATKAGVR